MGKVTNINDNSKKPIVESNGTDLQLSREEKFEKAYETLIKRDKELYYPQLSDNCVPEYRWDLFIKFIDIIRRNFMSDVEMQYFHNYLCAGINEGWDILENRMIVAISEIENKEKQKALQDFFDRFNILKNFVKDNKFTNDEFKLLSRLMKHKPLVPLQGTKDEWCDVMGDENLQQNKLYQCVFRRNKDNSTAYCIDNIIYSTDGGISWFTGNEKNINSEGPVTFPYDVPDEPIRRYLEIDVNDNYIDITDDNDRIDFVWNDYIARNNAINKVYNFKDAILSNNKKLVSENGELIIIKENDYIKIFTKDNVITIDSDTRFKRLIEEGEEDGPQ